MHRRTWPMTCRWLRRGRLVRCLVLSAVAGATPLVLAAGAAGAAGATGAARAALRAGGNEQAQAKQDLLVKADVPKGWTTTKNTDDGSSGLGTGIPAADEELASCIDVPPGVIEAEPPSVSSPELESPGDQFYTVTDQIVVFNSSTDAREQVAAYGSPKTARCVQSLAQGPYRNKVLGSVPKGVTIGAMTVTSADAAVVGPRAVGLVVHMPVTTQGVTVPVTMSEVVEAKGRLVQEITFSSFIEPFPASLERHLIAVAAARL